jgi:zinc transport system permease protein
MTATAVLAALPLPWPFERDFMQLALVAGIAVGVCAPLIGTFLVQKRLSLLGDGIGHVAFAGVAAGLVAGVWPVWTALLAACVSAVGIDRLRARRQTSGDLALALFFYSGIAAGVVLLGLGDGINANLFAYLFGSIITLTPGDVWVVVVLGAVIVVAVGTAWRALFTVVLDEDAARVAGLPVDMLNTALAMLAAVTVVAAMRVVGILLVAALMVLPVATAQVLARSFAGCLRWASVVGVVSTVVGLGVARAASVPPGGTIVLTAAVLYAIAAIAGGRGRAPVALDHRH